MSTQSPSPPQPHYHYKVVEVRSKIIGEKMSGQELERTLNHFGAQGWRLKSITAADVRGRVGPGGTEGLIVTFEWDPRRDLIDA